MIWAGPLSIRALVKPRPFYQAVTIDTYVARPCLPPLRRIY